MPDVFPLIREKATDLGFAAVGLRPPQAPPHYGRFLEWLAEDKCGQLTWLKKNLAVRQDPRRLLDGCSAIISLAFAYPSEQAGTPDGYTVARYASTPVDYHVRLKSLCPELTRVIEAAFPESRSRIVVDSAPILERSIAWSAGLGFFGKNNMLIVPGHGSFVNLVEILTTAPLPFESPDPMESRCGTCRRCIEACPTGALERPFFLNIAKCLAYLSVEHRGELEEDQGKAMGRCFVGCDRCQEVCPYNSPRRKTAVLSLPSTEEFLDMDNQTFSDRYGRTALGRPGLDKVKRNILAVRKGSPPFAPG